MITSEQSANILRFWFDDVNHQSRSKTLWFVADGSEEQKKVDLEISEKYGNLLKTCEAAEIVDLSLPNDSILSSILILDQFSRHIYRIAEGEEAASINSN